MKKRIAFLLALVFVLALATPALATSEASGEASSDADSAGPRSSSGVVAITVEAGAVTQDDSVALELAEDAVISEKEVSGISITSEDSSVGGVAWYGEGDFLLGGEADNYTVTTYYTGEELSFNSVISLDLADDYVWGTDSSGGFGITAAGDGTVIVENVYIRTAGISRYSLDVSSGIMVVKDTCFESLGCEGEYCDMPWFTMQYGASRNIIMTDTATVYVYNSLCATDGYASWSTDMTSGSMYLYNADCVNYNGGYGSYADGCRVYVYGSTFDCAEYGLFDCNGGTIIVGSSADAENVEDDGFLTYLEGEELEEDTPSVIIGDRNAVAMHVVATSSGADEARNGIVDTDTSEMYTTQPVLSATNSVFSTVGATGTSLGQFPVTIEMYLAHQKGSVFEFRSCNADVYLESCELESANGILFQSIIDLDGSAVQILDDIATEDIPGICIESVGNDWTGDISHEDYQRPMYLTLEDTTLTGAIYAGTIEDWLALWEGYAEVSYTLDEATGLYLNDAGPSD
ncbi:MAG: hypothetical protein LUH36_07830, partial [Oscillospiraceae bacterium]|nr:hypothetical protein [Oscillospiraceae bacterium]